MSSSIQNQNSANTPANIPVDTIVCGDSLTILRTLPSSIFDLVVTSPPYFRQRTYTSQTEEVGLEDSVDEYVDTLLVYFDECVRVIKETGNVLFNLGDKYDSASLLLIPYRFALRARERPGIRLINETRRHFVGIDLSEKYASAARARLATQRRSEAHGKV